MSPVRRFRIPALLASTLLMSACAGNEPAQIERDERIDLTATVEAVDQQTRMVVLRTADGRNATIQAGRDVRNLAQVRVGDRVLVNYYAGVAASVTNPKDTTQGVERHAAATRSAIGARPAGAIGELLTTTVEIESVDTSFHTVTFKRADGLQRTIGIDDPGTQQFIRKLKRGDRVQITYMEAIAVSVQPQA